MSYWTYIHGCIEVEVYGRTQHEKTYVLNTILDHLPRVTGSEGDMNILVNINPDMTTSCSCDEFGCNTNNLTDRYGNKVPYGWLRYTDVYHLTITGSLRDRVFDETYREFMKWLCRLSKRVHATNILVSIEGWKNDASHRTVIDEHGYNSAFYNMYEWPSWCRCNDEGEPAWWEYLTWDHAKNSQMPMKLTYKYYQDDENDRAIEELNAYVHSD